MASWKGKGLLALVLVMLLAFAGQAAAREVWVNNATGVDAAGRGTEIQPFATIGYAVAAATGVVTGGTVNVMTTGVPYVEDVVVNRAMTIRSTAFTQTGDRTQTILESPAFGTVLTIIANDVIIEGFTIRGAGNGVEITNRVSGCVIRNNIIGDITPPIIGAGVLLNDVRANTVHDNDFVECGAASVQLVLADGCVVRDNVIDGGGVSGFGVLTSRSTNNRIYDNEIFANSIGVELDVRSENNKVYGNEIDNNVVAGVRVDNISDNNEIYENEIHRNGAFGVWIDDSVGNAVSSNDIHRNIVGVQIVDTAVASTDNVVDNNIIRLNQNRGIVVIDSEYNVFTDNRVYDNGQVGVALRGAGIELDGARHNTFTGNEVYGQNDFVQRIGFILTELIGTQTPAENIVNNNSIYGHRDDGVDNDNAFIATPILADFRNNWWGDASGPWHATNPDGQGNSVTDNVRFDPWLTAAPGELPDPQVPGRVDLIGPEGAQASLDLTYRWNAVEHATSYRLWIERRVEGVWVCTWDEVLPAGTVSRTLAGHRANAEYRWWIKARNVDAGAGPWSNVMEFTTPGDVLTWGAYAGATWYEVYINRNGAFHHRQWVQGRTNLSVILGSGNYDWWVQPWGEGIGYGPWLAQPSFVK